VAAAFDAVELFLAGASAVQVGTATFADPQAPVLVQRDLLAWCTQRRIHRVAEIGALA
jgi:dihydroorotate dehydrogenase (NAD+) catalytic subunit